MANEFKIDLGQRLKEAREAARLTVKEMAERLECAIQTIYAYESGQNQAPMNVVVGYARATGLPLDRLGGVPEEEAFDPVLSILGVTEPSEPLAVDLATLPDDRLVSLMMKTAVEVSRRLIRRRS